MRIDGLVDVEEADVYKSGRVAGSLRRECDDVVFSYRTDYLDDPASPAVATTLPKTAAPVRATGGSVPSFFAGLLPEGLRLTAVTAATRTSQDDHLTLLLAVGGDTVGDVQVAPAGQPPNSNAPSLDEQEVGQADFEQLFARATSTDVATFERVALPGVQEKVSAQMISTPLTTSAGPAILKLNPPRTPRLVENEHFVLGMTGACGLNVPTHRLVHDRDHRAGLLVGRFDRVHVNGRSKRLAQEDACQVLDRYPSAKYRLTLQEAIRGLADVVAAGGGSRPLAIRKCLELAAFSYLIGNGDLHAKNLSVRQNPAGVWELTPAYDLLTTQPYLGWRDPMALPLYGRANRLPRRWWLDAAARLGLPERAIGNRLRRMVAAARPWVDRLAEIGFDEPTTARLRTLLGVRLDELAG